MRRALARGMTAARLRADDDRAGALGRAWRASSVTSSTRSGGKLRELAITNSRGSRLLIVAVGRKGIEIGPLLRHAGKPAVIEARTGDRDAAFYGALKKVEAKSGT